MKKSTIFRGKKQSKGEGRIDLVQEEKRKNIMTGKGIAEKIFCRKMQKRLQRIEQRETATDVVIITSAAVFFRRIW